MNETLCILVRRSPYGTVHAAEAFRHLAGALNSGLRITAILVDDGIYMARDNQQAEIFGWASLSESLSSFLNTGRGKDVKVFIHDSSLKTRGIEKERLVKEVELIDDKKLAEILGASHSVMLF
ncbi:MAG: DsrE family protein [Candidatus Aminicenantales bacterium]